MPALTFPKSSTPGAAPGEGEGRLINAYGELAGQTVYYRRVPGLVSVGTFAQAGPNGLCEVSGRFWASFTSGAVVNNAAPDFSYVTCTGTITGSQGVLFAHNNRTTGGALTPDIAAVRIEGGAYLVTATTVSAWPATNANTTLYTGTNGVPANVNSVSFLDGYLIFTVPDGRIFATGLNTTDCNPLSFATAEAHADGLVRGFVMGNKFYACGTDSIEIWFNGGSSPFPLQRDATVIQIGLLAPLAVAGFEPGWNRAAILVASDGTVRQIADLAASDPISTPDVERFIAASTTSTLRASVYVDRGHAVWLLTSNLGTWAYDVSTGAWHERSSVGANGWRGYGGALITGNWYTLDTLAGALLRIDATATTESGAALNATIESGPLREFPKRPVGASLSAEFTQSASNTVAISWTHDGWATTIGPKTLSLARADKAPIRVNRLGMANRRGFQVRFVVSGPDAFSFQRADLDVADVRAA